MNDDGFAGFVVAAQFQRGRNAAAADTRRSFERSLHGVTEHGLAEFGAADAQTLYLKGGKPARPVLKERPGLFLHLLHRKRSLRCIFLGGGRGFRQAQHSGGVERDFRHGKRLRQLTPVHGELGAFRLQPHALFIANAYSRRLKTERQRTLNAVNAGAESSGQGLERSVDRAREPGFAGRTVQKEQTAASGRHEKTERSGNAPRRKAQQAALLLGRRTAVVFRRRGRGVLGGQVFVVLFFVHQKLCPMLM